MKLLEQARGILQRHCREDHLALSVMPGVHLMRFGWRSLPVISTQYACMALVLQGTKSVEFGGEALEYGAGQYLLASMDVPTASRVVNASSRQPLLALAIEIELDAVRQVVERCDELPRIAPQSAVQVYDADEELLDSVVRMLRLLDRRQQIGPLQPLLRQEVYYRLLSGGAGSRLIEVCRHGSASNRIAEAIGWMREHFAEAFLVEELAHQVGMSVASFHQHFRDVTGMPPVRYQKRLRLIEARRLLVMEALGIGDASFRVGYQSHSQFSRDYRLYFGRLPKDDIRAVAQGEIAIDAYRPA